MSDIIIIAILALAGVYGFFKGVLKAILRFVEGLITFALGIGAALLVLNIFQENEYAIVFAIVAFLVMFIVSIIFLDYFLNRIVYSRKSKSILKDRIIGLFVNLLIWTAILFLVYAVIATLQGTEYDHFYLAVTDNTVITKFFVTVNPFKTLIANLFNETIIPAGICGILAGYNTDMTLGQFFGGLLTSLWPNFEYLGAVI